MLKEARIAGVSVNQTGPSKQRHLDLTGAKNFRDLGGYQTVDGRTVRWGLLFRSDGLQALTEADLQQLALLNLERVIDFRSEYEKELGVDRLPVASNIRRVEIPILDASSALVREARDELVKKLRTIDPAQYMLESYMGFVQKFTPEFKRFFSELKSAEGRPVLFHCTAGKDRTGFAAALFLRLVGVPHETTLEDYLLTNTYFFAGHRWNLMLARLMKGKRFAETLRGFMRAEAQYLSTAFDTIDRDYGSFENYMRVGIGLSTADVERFKLIYLE